MIFVYYIGGPWDLHKVAASKEQKLGSILTVRIFKPSLSLAEISFVDHQYTLRPVGKNVFVAVHSEMLR